MLCGKPPECAAVSKFLILGMSEMQKAPYAVYTHPCMPIFAVSNCYIASAKYKSANKQQELYADSCLCMQRQTSLFYMPVALNVTFA